MDPLPRPVRAAREDHPSARLICGDLSNYFLILLDHPAVLQTHFVPGVALGEKGNTRGHYDRDCGYCQRGLRLVPQAYCPVLAIRAGGILTAARAPADAWLPAILHVPTSSLRRLEEASILRRIAKLKRLNPKSLVLDGSSNLADPAFPVPPPPDLDYDLAKYLYPTEWDAHLKALAAEPAATLPLTRRRAEGGAS